jgi:hypothetical protein
MIHQGTILISCDVDQPLEVGNELLADKMSVRAGHLLRENLLEIALRARNQTAHAGQLAEDKIVQCSEELVEVGRVLLPLEEWRILQVISARAQPPVLDSAWQITSVSLN